MKCLMECTRFPYFINSIKFTRKFIMNELLVFSVYRTQKSLFKAPEANSFLPHFSLNYTPQDVLFFIFSYTVETGTTPRRSKQRLPNIQQLVVFQSARRVVFSIQTRDKAFVICVRARAFDRSSERKHTRTFSYFRTQMIFHAVREMIRNVEWNCLTAHTTRGYPSGILRSCILWQSCQDSLRTRLSSFEMMDMKKSNMKKISI